MICGSTDNPVSTWFIRRYSTAYILIKVSNRNTDLDYECERNKGDGKKQKNGRRTQLAVGMREEWRGRERLQ